MNVNKEIWNYPPDVRKKGYREEEEGYFCIICGAYFEKGRIYSLESGMYDAYGAVRRHAAAIHGNMADYILEQETGLTGISEIQRQILKMMSQGKSDKEIGEAAGIAASTVRNHRFKLREREKQAKMFLTLMECLEEKISAGIGDSDAGALMEVHSSATMIDDRYGITEQEREKTIKTYMDEYGAIRQFPAREKKKIILLREIVKNFKKNAEYSETEVNRILERIYQEDYPSLRRALIEYGFMDRSRDCKVYRVKE